MGVMEGWKPPFLPAPEGGGFMAAATVNAACFLYASPCLHYTVFAHLARSTALSGPGVNSGVFSRRGYPLYSTMEATPLGFDSICPVCLQ